ncbi:hypothetical protein F0M16_10860 [Vibrio cholerae]|uniref:Uncharacterized protein n=1 Tax=Vibrio cholerae TaxID=666 RepID=A0A5Q6PJD0_VIBCL|nr:hypothetical protein [Vibrio cholerae]KAA1254759.1 hypothetical protein F0M16_10860 [Vibrio cholerae]
MRVVKTPIHEQVKAKREDKSVNDMLGGVRRLIFIMIPLMIGATIFEHYIRDSMSVTEYISRLISIYICIGAAINLNDCFRSKPYSPTTVFTWPKRLIKKT